ncbi:ATP-binding cassette domain-containing protein [Nonomuraea typhae]|uniref:ATP-binding cassette domain-containing protein n=1 Tax=Nonomuraea typhae TaxID=2603600 RepID=A0ABW7YND8_9ACTN
MRSLTAGYRRRAVLHDLTAVVPRARHTVVMGANGSGKSTLLSVFARLVRPMSGRLSLPARCALVVQDGPSAQAMPITVRQVMAMARWKGPWRPATRHDRAVVDRRLAELGVLDLAERQFGTLSGGQRQRVLVAQGLAQEAELLLLDEPATGVDEAARERIREALAAAVAQGTTVVQATHDRRAALDADLCLTLEAGRLS